MSSLSFSRLKFANETVKSARKRFRNVCCTPCRCLNTILLWRQQIVLTNCFCWLISIDLKRLNIKASPILLFGICDIKLSLWLSLEMSMLARRFWRWLIELLPPEATYVSFGLAMDKYLHQQFGKHKNYIVVHNKSDETFTYLHSFIKLAL